MSARPSSALSPSSQTEESRIAVLSLVEQAPADEAAWLAACYHLTPRVARLSPSSAALDLGRCTEQEAFSVAQGLADRLRWADLHVRIGIGPTLPVAHLAVLSCPAPQRIALISAANVPPFLRPLPVASLCALHLPVPITEETVYRLRRYGVMTLGQLARLDERTLRRQFGAVVGTHLAALARGEASTAFHPTPPAPVLRFRARFPAPLTIEETRRRLPGLAEEIIARLRTLNQTAGVLALTVSWESGAIERAEETLREPTQDPYPLAQRLTALLTSLLRPHANRSPVQGGKIEHLDVLLSAVAPLRPRQHALWFTPRPLRDERLRKALTLAETLAQRYRRPVLLAARPTDEAATFSEDRYRLTPLRADTLVDTQVDALPLSSRQRAAARQGDPQDDHWQNALIQPHWW
jgi:nucleotidyltransferase/DNA polymerase involved in DNA repair